MFRLWAAFGFFGTKKSLVVPTSRSISVVVHSSALPPPPVLSSATVHAETMTYGAVSGNSGAGDDEADEQKDVDGSRRRSTAAMGSFGYALPLVAPRTPSSLSYCHDSPTGLLPPVTAGSMQFIFR